ncbi:nitric oxide synthase-interacting protein-like [Saccostrea echinata]|uniref:nitric oxide synthase-interacting protein-like n=1 Tax=Saccostrea echinata TaxID=191078 RepID=UPI002A80E2EC|nr:nitric oxide synthase-interacting protein-like [Saccostrea echinata]
MTRHSRNCTAGTVYSYHERQKDTNQSGYGSKKSRLGKDSIKDFDCCNLTLQPCRNPVVTQDGYLYDKESILEYILKKKKEIARKQKEYEKQKNREKEELAELAKAESETQKQEFMSANSQAPVTKQTGDKPSTSSISNMQEGKNKALPSFWIPSMTPAANATKMDKPDEKVRCPMSGKPIKLKDLFPVHFTPIKDRDEKTALISKQARYVCAVTNDVLGNSVPCAVLKTSGSVVTLDCVEKLLKKDMLDPINNKPMKDSDIIPLKGASGFSGSGHQLEVKKDGAAIMA